MTIRMKTIPVTVCLCAWLVSYRSYDLYGNISLRNTRFLFFALILLGMGCLVGTSTATELTDSETVSCPPNIHPPEFHFPEIPPICAGDSLCYELLITDPDWNENITLTLLEGPIEWEPLGIIALCNRGRSGLEETGKAAQQSIRPSCC